MQQKPQSQINLKRGAFRSKIRRQWLDKYFQQKRTELLKTHQNQMENEEMLRKRCSEWFENLPQEEAVNQLRIEYCSNKEGMIKFVNENLDQFIGTAREINIKTFNLYTTLLCNIVIYFPECKKEMMQMTLRMMLGQGQRLMQQDLMQKHVAIMSLVEFILVLSDTFFNMDQLLIENVCKVLNESLAFTEYFINELIFRNCYVQTLQIINQFLIASVNGLDQKQDQQNIEAKDEYDLLFAKKQVITKIFQQNLQNINTLIHNASVLNDDVRITVITLKVLTNITYYSVENKISHQIFNCNYFHLMFSVMSNFPKNSLCFILLISLLNNLLLVDKKITETAYEEMHFRQLVKNYNSIKGENSFLVEEFCQVIGNIVFFMEDFKQIMIYLMDREIVDILIEGCQIIKNEEKLPHLLTCFSILINVDKDFITMKIRENAKIFEKLAQTDEENINQIAIHLLEQSFKEHEHEKSLDHPIESYQEKDVQI